MSSEWEKREIRMQPNHGWKTQKEGYKIFVADRGAVRFEFPGNWELSPPKGNRRSFQMYDGKPPNDNIRLEVSHFYLPGFNERGQPIDWKGLPLAQMIDDVTRDRSREQTRRGQTFAIQFPGLEMAWLETEFMDPGEKRPAHTRICLARGGGVQALITMDFWPEDGATARGVWNDVVSSLKLGQYIESPSRGPDV